MKISDFQEKIVAFDWREFESFVADVLRSTNRFREIQQNVVIAGRQIDMVAIESNELISEPTHWLFEIKAYKNSRLSVRDVDQIAGLALTLSHELQQRHLVIATTLPPSAAARESARRLGVEIWDQSKLLELASSKVLKEYFGVTSSETEPDEPTLSKGNALLESLKSTNPGRSEWSAYQRLMSEILEFLFCPPLDTPKNEIPDQDARNRRDMIFENNAESGFWARLRSGYEAHYIVVDAKNYVSGLKKGPILDVAHYLKPHGCGMFALITSRKGASGAAWHAVREQWIASRKLILVLDDQDIEEMISLKVEAGDPEDLIRRRIAEFRVSM